MIDAEKMIWAFKPIRDQVIFTKRRIFVVNVKGLTGKKLHKGQWKNESFNNKTAMGNVDNAGR